MLDLETFGKGNDSVIISIGAVHFCRNEGILDRFYINVDPADCQKHGLKIDSSTVLWWMSQSEDSRRAVTEPKISVGTNLSGDGASTRRFSLEEALAEFNDWLHTLAFTTEEYERILEGEDIPMDVAVWGCGSDFDNVLIENAHKALGQEIAWNFRNNRCYRTIKSLWPNVKIKRKGEHHNALDDAESQALHLIEICNSFDIHELPAL